MPEKSTKTTKKAARSETETKDMLASQRRHAKRALERNVEPGTNKPMSKRTRALYKRVIARTDKQLGAVQPYKPGLREGAKGIVQIAKDVVRLGKKGKANLQEIRDKSGG